MGFLKKLKKAVKKVGKSVGSTVKKIGKQVKRSTAVAAPALLGPGLGEKVGVYVSRTAGKTAKKSTLKGMAKVGRVGGTVVQVVGTAVATYFGGPVAGKAAYAVTGYAKKGGAFIVKQEQYKQGFKSTKPTRPSFVANVVQGVASVVGALVGGGGGGVGIGGGGGGGGGDGPAGDYGASGDYGAPGSSGVYGASGGAGTADGDTLKQAAIVGAILLAAWYMTKGK
jgi:hypothetical protein